MENEIQLLDSSEYHKTRKEELKFQSKIYLTKIKAFLLSKYFIMIIVWVILLRVALKTGMGHVYLTFSGIAFIFLNLGKRKPGAPSAYSVFNKNFQSILGTFDINQVESQLLNRDAGYNDYYSEIGNNIDLDNEDEVQKAIKFKAFAEKNPSKAANKECYCGSEKKYKKCCYWRELRRKEEAEKALKEERLKAYKEERLKKQR